MLVLPKFLGVDREYRRPETGQERMSREVAQHEANAQPFKQCDCMCCRTLNSPAAPGRNLCYGCLRFHCKPETERTFPGRSYMELQEKRQRWEYDYPGWRLVLAREWTEIRPPTMENPMGRRTLWQRYLVRKA
jgi:hypothetical protein